MKDGQRAWLRGDGASPYAACRIHGDQDADAEEVTIRYFDCGPKTMTVPRAVLVLEIPEEEALGEISEVEELPPLGGDSTGAPEGGDSTGAPEGGDPEAPISPLQGEEDPSVSDDLEIRETPPNS